MDSRKQPLRFLFLYTRLPDYFYRCIIHLLDNSPAGSRAWVVCYEADKDAPYEHTADERIEFLTRSAFNPDEVDTVIQPAIIYVAGWGDAVYKSVIKRKRSAVPVVMGLDNPWLGTPKQRLATLLSPFTIKRLCTHIWVAGKPQYTYARKLGFKPTRILSGLYCANTEGILYDPARVYDQKTILYTGRLVDYKRPHWLLRAFTELIEGNPMLADWKVILIGDGPMAGELSAKYGTMKQLTMAGFQQPAIARKYYEQPSLFCLPSHNEHWGVVVQEAAAAGLPLLLSDACGAASEFLEQGANGYAFDTNSYDDFKQKLLQLMSNTAESLQQMGVASRELSLRITPEHWTTAFKNVLIGA